MSSDLLSIIMNDGSRHFCDLPETVSFEELKIYAGNLPEVEITGFLTDSVTEVWLDFDYRNEKFSVNNQFGEYWFFVKDPKCSDSTLSLVKAHFEDLLEK